MRRVTGRAQSLAARARPLRRAGQGWTSGWRDCGHGRILRREFEGAAEFRFGSGEIEIEMLENHALCRMRIGEIRIQSERALAPRHGLLRSPLVFLSAAIRPKLVARFSAALDSFA